MTFPLVSVTVPAYNQAEYLRSCLDALWFQEYPDLEIVVVNDGATDNTAEIIEEFQADLKKKMTSYASRYDEKADQIERIYHLVFQREGRTLKVITHEQNKGLSEALNTGWTNSTGVYTTYMPCDDIPYPHMISSLVNALMDGNKDFAFADMFIVKDDMQIVRRFSLPEYSFDACFGQWYFCGVCKLYKRELHDQFGGYDPALLAHDHALFQKFAIGGAQFVHVDKALMAVRDHAQGREVDIHSPTSWSQLLEESKQLVLEARELLRKRGK